MGVLRIAVPSLLCGVKSVQIMATAVAVDGPEFDVCGGQ